MSLISSFSLMQRNDDIFQLFCSIMLDMVVSDVKSQYVVAIQLGEIFSMLLYSGVEIRMLPVLADWSFIDSDS